MVVAWQQPGGGDHILGLDAAQLLTTGQHHLAQLLQTGFQFAQHLFGVAVGPLLHAGRFLTAACHQGITLLLGLLTELQGVLVQAFRFGLAVPVNAQPFQANRFEFLHGLVTAPFVLFHQLAVALGGLLFQLLAPGLGLLLQLLAAQGKLLLHLGHAALVLLLSKGRLLTTLQQNLFALLAGLFPQFGGLLLCFLTDGGAADQLLPLAAGLGQDLIGLLTGFLDEGLPLEKQFLGLGQLAG